MSCRFGIVGIQRFILSVIKKLREVRLRPATRVTRCKRIVALLGLQVSTRVLLLFLCFFLFLVLFVCTKLDFSVRPPNSGTTL